MLGSSQYTNAVTGRLRLAEELIEAGGLNPPPVLLREHADEALSTTGPPNSERNSSARETGMRRSAANKPRERKPGIEDTPAPVGHGEHQITNTTVQVSR